MAGVFVASPPDVR